MTSSTHTPRHRAEGPSDWDQAQHAAWSQSLDERRPGSDTSWEAYREAMES